MSAFSSQTIILMVTIKTQDLLHLILLLAPSTQATPPTHTILLSLTHAPTTRIRHPPTIAALRVISSQQSGSLAHPRNVLSPMVASSMSVRMMMIPQLSHAMFLPIRASLQPDDVAVLCTIHVQQFLHPLVVVSMTGQQFSSKVITTEIQNRSMLAITHTPFRHTLYSKLLSPSL